jgi:hypothetical protein
LSLLSIINVDFEVFGAKEIRPAQKIDRMEKFHRIWSHCCRRTFQVRYNVYDRAVHRMDLDTQRKFYTFMPLLSKVSIT